MNFADCVLRVSQGSGINKKSFYNPTREIVQDFLTRKGFPRYTGPMSKADILMVKNSIKETAVISKNADSLLERVPLLKDLLK